MLTLSRPDAAGAAARVTVFWFSGRWTLRGPDGKECSRADLAEAADELERLLRESAARLPGSGP